MLSFWINTTQDLLFLGGVVPLGVVLLSALLCHSADNIRYLRIRSVAHHAGITLVLLGLSFAILNLAAWLAFTIFVVAAEANGSGATYGEWRFSILLSMSFYAAALVIWRVIRLLYRRLKHRYGDQLSRWTAMRYEPYREMLGKETQRKLRQRLNGEDENGE